MARFESGEEFQLRRWNIEREKELLRNTHTITPQPTKSESVNKLTSEQAAKSESVNKLTSEQATAIVAGFHSCYETTEQRRIRRENYYKSRAQ